MAAVLGCLVCTWTPTQAQAREPHRLTFNTGAQLVGLGVLTGVALGWLLLDLPDDCRLCDPPGLDRGVAEAIGTTGSPQPWKGISDALLYGGFGLALLVPTAGASHFEMWLEDVAIASTATLAAVVVSAYTKLLVARLRPGPFFRNDQAEISEDETNLSFFSGHAGLTAAVVASTTTVAYLRGYAHRHLLAAIGTGWVLATGLLRIPAHRHWLTDVLAGWAVGAALGIVLPLALHRRRDQPDQADPAAAAMPLVVGSF